MSIKAIMHRLGGSRSTDKLAVLAVVAEEAMARDASLLRRIKSLELDWVERSGEVFPNLKIEFKEPVSQGSTIL